MAWIVGLVFAAIFWFLSTMGFVDQANEIGLIKQVGLDLRVALVQIGVVSIMFPLVDMIFLKPLRQSLDDRTKYLEDTYSEADSLKARMEDLKTSYEAKLAASEADSRAQIQAALQEAQGMKDGIISDAKSQADDIRAKGLADLNRERDKMVLDLRTQAVDLTLIATEKLIGASMDDDRQRRLAREFIETAEVGR